MTAEDARFAIVVVALAMAIAVLARIVMYQAIGVFS